MYPALFFIVSISIIKDGYEDYQHYKSDMEENNKDVNLVDPETGELKKVTWQSLRAGQVIKIDEDDVLPADILIIRTSDDKCKSISPFIINRTLLYRDKESGWRDQPQAKDRPQDGFQKVQELGSYFKKAVLVQV